MIESRTSGRQGLTIGALLVANLLLACGPLLVRLANSVADVGPVAAGFWRLALALPVLLVAAGGRERAAPRPVPALAVIALGGVAFAADLGLWHLGILRTRLANATLLGNVTAFLFPLYGFAVARTWPQPRQWIAMMLASVGTLLLLGRSYELSGEHLAGDLACIAAGLCYTAYLIAIDRVRGATGPITTLAVSVLAGVPVLLGFALLMGEPLWPRAWWPLLLLSAGSQVIGQGLILFAVGRVAPLVVGLMLLTQPIVSAAIGWAAYGERLTAADLIGAVGIAIAVVLVRERRPPPDPAAGGLPPGDGRLSSAA